jgi:hypothetical protein
MNAKNKTKKGTIDEIHFILLLYQSKYLNLF